MKKKMVFCKFIQRINQALNFYENDDDNDVLIMKIFL